MTVPRKHFKRDGAIITGGAELTHMRGYIQFSHTQREVEVGVAAAIVVKMNMREPSRVTRNQLPGRAPLHTEIAVPDVEVQRGFPDDIENGTKLRDRIEPSGHISSSMIPMPSGVANATSSCNDAMLRCTTVRSSVKGACPSGCTFIHFAPTAANSSAARFSSSIAARLSDSNDDPMGR
jgi:hypothetical protein